MIYEDLRERHFGEMGLCPLIGEDTYCGFAARDQEGALQAIAIVYCNEAGRWNVMFARRDGCTAGVHRMMLKLAKTLAEVGLSEIWAECDDAIPNARYWLERGGFAQVGESNEWRLALKKD